MTHLSQCFEIGSHEVRSHGRPFVIAEAGSNFNQSMDMAHRLIDCAAKAGADAVKFQLFRAETLVSPGEDGYELFKSVELDPDWVPDLDAHCRSNGVLFMASAFDKASVDVLEGVEVCAYKVASSETTNLPLLAYMAKTGKPLIVSTGMCDMVDINEAVNLCLAQDNDRLVLLQCGTVYPLPPEDANLRVMDLLGESFGAPIGFSDHTLGMSASIAAVALGAAVIEKHFTLDKSAEGPDHFYALEPDELDRFIAALREAHASLGNRKKELLPKEREFGRREGLYAARDIAVGKVLKHEDIAVKRPALGLRARYLMDAIGASARRDIASGEPIDWHDITL